VAAGSNRGSGVGRRRTRAGRSRLSAVVAVAGLLWLGLGAQAHAASTYTVNTSADNLPTASDCDGAAGDCSLRQALDKAHSGDLVLVPASRSPYEIVSQQIPVRSGVTIKGAGDAVTTLTGGDADQAFGLEGGGTVTITGMTLTHFYNDSGQDEGGAINGPGEDPLTLEDVTISESESPTGYGGAIEIGAGGLRISHSRFVGDTASGVPAKGPGGGGAIELGLNASSPGSLTVSDSVFAGDSTAEGSGGAVELENKDVLTVGSSTFAGNIAGGGAPGGAIALQIGSKATIVNSTFTGNAAGVGGAIWTKAETLSLLGDTLAGNAAEEGSNLAARTGTGITTLENTIVATPLAGPEEPSPQNCSGKITSGGHNLEDTEPSTCGLGASGDIVGESPQLLALANNSSIDPTAGGPPQTLALASTSPAVGAAEASGCADEGSVDERGFPRPGIEAGGCDIGAYELLPAVPTATTLTASSASSSYGQPLTLTATVLARRGLPPAVPDPGGSVEFLDGGASLGSASIGAGGLVTLTTPALPAGEQSVTAVYRGDPVHAGSSSGALGLDVAAAPAGRQQALHSTATPPKLAHARESHSRWREGARLASLAAAGGHRPPVGTAFSFGLSTPAAVTLTFTHAVAGRRRQRRCVAQTRRNRRAPACRRMVSVGALRFASVPAGNRSIHFDGRLSRTRRLAPGSYTVTIIAVNSRGPSAAVHLTFTIVKG